MTTFNNPPCVETRIQRLVDGVLSDAERVTLLREIDLQPKLWRDVALAFVELQLWDRELSAWNSANAATCLTTTSATRNEPLGPEHPRTKSDTVRQPQIAELQVSARHVGDESDERSVKKPVAVTDRAGMARSAALARGSDSHDAMSVAALMLATISLAVAAFFLGNAGRTTRPITLSEPANAMSTTMIAPVIDNSAIANSAIANNSQESVTIEAQDTLDDDDSSYRLQWINSDGQPLELPVLSEDRLAQVIAEIRNAQSSVPAQAMRRFGYQLDTETRFVAQELDNGRQLIVPVQAFTVNYHAH